MGLLSWDTLAWVRCSPSLVCPWDKCSTKAQRGSQGCSPAELIQNMSKTVTRTVFLPESQFPLHPSFPTLGVAAAWAEQPFEHSGGKTNLLS